MLDDDTLVELVRTSFQKDTRSVAASPGLAGDIRSRRMRRQRATYASIACTAVLAVVMTVVLQDRANTPTSSAVGNDSTKSLQLSGYTFQIPADAKTTTTCLKDLQTWSAKWTAEPATVTIASYLRVVLPDGSYASNPAGEECIGAAFTYSVSVPPPIDTVKATGLPTVDIIASTPDTRTAYITLDPQESAAAAQRTGGPSGVTYYVVGEVPSDNDQAVLVSLLQRGQMTALLAIHDSGPSPSK